MLICAFAAVYMQELPSGMHVSIVTGTRMLDVSTCQLCIVASTGKDLW